MSKKMLLRIAIFYIIAIGVSNIVRFQLFGIDKLYEQLPLIGKIMVSPLQSIAIMLAALLALYKLSKERPTKYGLFGTSKKWSLVMGVVPVIIFGIFGIDNSVGLNPHIMGFLAGLFLLVYCIFEEYGWRGYLEDELSGQKEWIRVLVIGVLWYLWHLSFLNSPGIIENFKFFGLLLLGSWGIGKIVQSTKSVLVAACFHMIYNTWMMQIETNYIVSRSKKLWLIGACLIIWIVILKVWRRGQLKNQ